MLYFSKLLKKAIIENFLFMIPFFSFLSVFVILSLSMIFIPVIILFSLSEFILSESFFSNAEITAGNIFIYTFVDIIEYAFFEILLFILVLGMYNNIIEPFWEQKNTDSFGELFENFIKKFSHPFLIIVSSMLIVSVFKFIYIPKQFIGIIEMAVTVLIILISIGILIKIEKSIVE